MHAFATINCPHPPGTVTIPVMTSNTEVFVSGNAIVTKDDQYVITKCALQSIGQPFCVSITWKKTSSNILVRGHYVVLQDSTGICNNASSPQPVPNLAIVTATQTKVTGK